MQSYEDAPPMRVLSPSLVGLVMGTSAAIPLYLWQSTVQVAVASFIIAGYTSWLWARWHNHAAMGALLNIELRQLQVNAIRRRIIRMLLDPGYWWTMLFGGTIVAASVWHAGLDDPLTLAGISVAWGMVAICLSYGLTLIHPVSNCRRCGYNLTGQISRKERTIRCPECGARWSRALLGQPERTTLTNIDWRRAA